MVGRGLVGGYICTTAPHQGTFKHNCVEEETDKHTHTHIHSRQEQQQHLKLIRDRLKTWTLALCVCVCFFFLLEMSNVQLSSSALERLAARRTFPLHRRTGVCRNLFGPVDHDELSREMKAKLREISERDQQRWNFNFEANTPLVGDYEWEEVSVDTTPVFYQDSVQNERSRTPVAPVRQTPSPDSVLLETPRMDVLERLASPESSGAPSPVEVNQENRSDKLNSGKRKHRQVPCVRRKRTDTTDNNTHITDFFVKRKRAADRKPNEMNACHPSKSPVPLEQTPRKRIR
ncbi:cyclin-dependent kinase inhibitor 1B [Antennarius striatus]|uniref:cyclin-dependent kinase inhibitor 1B n=1 Tax=Antennarius striatus TaxID=241820 RepID=UPI0035AF45A3